MEPTNVGQVDASIVQTVADSITGNVTTILPIAIGVFALMFGVKLVPKLVKRFSN